MFINAKVRNIYSGSISLLIEKTRYKELNSMLYSMFILNKVNE